MAVAVDDDLNGALPVNRQEFALVACRVNDGANLIIDENGIAGRILPATDKPDLTCFKIKHRALNPSGIEMGKAHCGAPPQFSRFPVFVNGLMGYCLRAGGDRADPPWNAFSLKRTAP